jgi:hypothetical protein
MPTGMSLITYWCAQSDTPYSAPKVRRDMLQIFRTVGVKTLHINKSTDIRPSLFRERKNGKRVVSLVQYPLKPLLNISDDNFSEAFDSMHIINDYSHRTVIIVHDIKSLQTTLFRKEISDTLLDGIRRFEKLLFEQADYIIVHSHRMGQYISSQFTIKARIIPLEFFDYLSEPTNARLGEPQTKRKVAFAGYLGPAKDNLLQAIFSHLPKANEISYNLYGADLPVRRYSREDINYRGAFQPDILPSVLRQENDLGLLWDALDKRQMQYYGMIVPHKCSLYIRAGLPLVVPKETYIGAKAEDLHIGYSIGSLDDLLDLNPHRDISMNNLQDMQSKVASGHFTRRMIKKILDYEG